MITDWLMIRVEFVCTLQVIILLYYYTRQEFNNKSIKCEEITKCWTDRSNMIDHGRMLRERKD